MMNATGLAFDHEGMLYVSSRYDGIVYQVTPNGNMSVYVEGMGVATGLAFDPGRQPLRRRPQRHDFQDQPHPPDFRLRHARAFHRRLSSGVRPGRLPVRHRAHHLQLRFRLPHLARRRSGDVLSRPGPSAGHGLRRGRPPVCRGFARRPQRRGAHYARPAAPSCSSPARASWAWRSRLRAPWWSPPPMRSIAWTSASKAGSSA